MNQPHSILRWIPIVAIAAGAALLWSRPLELHHTPDNGPISAESALSLLREGNERFSHGTALRPNTDQTRRTETSRFGQHPFATVIGCADSRVPVEMLFDEGIGDLFVIRVAGNVCGTDETGSIEYAVEHLKTTLVVVMGHRECGAVKAVIAGCHEHGSIPALCSHIAPAVERVRKAHPELNDTALVQAAVRENVWQSIADLLAHSASARHRTSEGLLRIEGAVYDIETAQVEWLGRHPLEAQLVQSNPGNTATPH